MVFGVVVGVAKLVACLHIHQPETWGEWRYLLDHEHANGPWCWVLQDVRALTTPIPCRGAQQFWPVPVEIEAQMREQFPVAKREAATA
jgi:hypothetical protein